MNSDPVLASWGSLFNNTVRVISISLLVVESINWLLVPVDLILGNQLFVSSVSLMSWLNVKMSSCRLEFITIVLLFVLVLVVMQSSCMRIVMDNASDLITWMGNLLDEVLNIVLSLISNSVLDTEVCKLLWSHDMLLRGRWHTGSN